jgi:hypothetical protein
MGLKDWAKKAAAPKGEQFTPKQTEDRRKWGYAGYEPGNGWAKIKTDPKITGYEPGGGIAPAWEQDQKEFAKLMADARAYKPDTDHDGKKANVIYDRIDRMQSAIQPHSNRGQEKADEMLRELTRVSSNKIGPASRAKLPGQKNAK